MPPPINPIRNSLDSGTLLDRGGRLTLREREIAQQMLTGGTSKQIARLLAISPRTVEAHRARLMKKLGAANHGELIARLAGLP